RARSASEVIAVFGIDCRMCSALSGCYIMMRSALSSAGMPLSQRHDADHDRAAVAASSRRIWVVVRIICR
ncbi:MAG: hypothetical protein K2O07_04175, partial [Alistipes sp.]|nr:hypothetical protein [Alistipes sp.]